MQKYIFISAIRIVIQGIKIQKTQIIYYSSDYDLLSVT